jgi:hypothetical protein
MYCDWRGSLRTDYLEIYVKLLIANCTSLDTECGMLTRLNLNFLNNSRDRKKCPDVGSRLVL